MATFSQGTSSPLTPKLVVPGVIAVEKAKRSFFEKFKGEGKNNIIQVLNNLKKQAGDQVTVALRMKISGEGITGDSTLEGNEVAFSLKNMAIKVDQRRQAIRLAGKMTEKRSAVKLRKEAVDALATWAAEVEDEELFYHLSCTRGVRAGTLPLSYAGGAQGGFVTADAAHKAFADGLAYATLTADDKLDCADIDALVEQARLLDPQIEPIKVNGADHYILVISPEQATDLRQDTTWINAQKDANVRGNENPIFSGAMGMYNGVVVHVHRNVVKFSDAGSGGDVAGCIALFLGAQAGIVAEADGTDYEEETFDYKNQVGFEVGWINGVKGAAFKDDDGTNEKLFGRILLYTAI